MHEPRLLGKNTADVALFYDPGNIMALTNYCSQTLFTAIFIFLVMHIILF